MGDQLLEITFIGTVSTGSYVALDWKLNIVSFEITSPLVYVGVIVIAFSCQAG